MRGLVSALRRRVSLKLTLTLVGFVAIVLAVAGFYLSAALESFSERTLEARLATVARLLHEDARGLLTTGAQAAVLQTFVARAAAPTEARVTLIASDGRVLADSSVALADVPRLENHGHRPEVAAALAGRLGRAVRRSETVHEALFYVGMPVQQDGRVIGVLRLALPVSAVAAAHRAIGRVLAAGGVVALAAALGIGLFVSRRITRPLLEMERVARRMSQGDFHVRAPSLSTDEIGSLGRALNVLAASLRDRIQDLEDERAKITAMLDAMVEGVVAVNGRDEIVLINEPARRMFGVPAGHGAQKPLLEVLRNVDLHGVARRARGALSGDVLKREITLDQPASRRIQVHAMPLPLGAGPLGVVMVLHDVTDLRRLEQVRTEFVANVSHELRTPLTAIQGYVETLLGGVEDPAEGRAFLDVVHRHTQRLARLLNDLTDLSNIELGRVSLNLGPVPVSHVVEAVVAMLRPRAESAGVGLASEVPAHLHVRADHDRLHQIVINLVDNALKYTAAGGHVVIRARRVDDRVELEVCDTGIGIAPGDLSRITERFYRVDRTRSREVPGTGLGLAIVKHLVQAHDGQLVIESATGHGTTVRVILPLAAGGEADDTTHARQ
ncbi:MAG TPA: ATP-binding protein [Methylomirabilota bacterium]|nr:ATP-binding protein [Methylomirabilota bacterium]